MAIGVPENDVFQAADAVLARGERPTVERVRAELGRGSPARVGQLLEQWWEELAQRLKGYALLPELPGDVAQAFAETWRLALAQGEAIAQSALMAEKNVLFAEQKTLIQERKVWDIALAEAQASVAEHATQRELADRQLIERQTLVDQLAAQITDLTQQRNRLQSQGERNHDELRTLRNELAASQAHIQGIEDRAHQQVDHARQALKTLQQRLDREAREHGKALTRVTAQRDELRAALQKSEQQAAHQSGQVAALEAAIKQWRRDQPAGSKPAQKKARPAATAKSRSQRKKVSP